MLEQKVKAIIEKQEAFNELERKIAEYDMGKQALLSEHFKAKHELVNDKANLGKIIAPISQNIIMEVNNKIYCIFYNRKYGTAGILEAISAKDAELTLCVNKMETLK